MKFEAKTTPFSSLAMDAKLFVMNHPLFGKPAANDLHVTLFDPTIAMWFAKKNVTQVSGAAYAANFFFGLYLRDVVLRRAAGADVKDTLGKSVYMCAQPEHIVWQHQLCAVFDANLTYIERFLFTYLCAATAGELRHCVNKAPTVSKKILKTWAIMSPSGTMYSRSETQRLFLEALKPADATAYLTEADKAFRGHKWAGSYGGVKWADIAKTGLDRIKDELDPVLFVDRVFDLKHNGGPMFDKNSVITQENLPNFLDAKFALTSDKAWTPWMTLLCDDLLTLVQEAHALKLWEGSVPVEGANHQFAKMQPTATTDGVQQISMPSVSSFASSPTPKLSTPDFKHMKDPCPEGHQHDSANSASHV